MKVTEANLTILARTTADRVYTCKATNELGSMSKKFTVYNTAFVSTLNWLLLCVLVTLSCLYHEIGNRSA